MREKLPRLQLHSQRVKEISSSDILILVISRKLAMETQDSEMIVKDVENISRFETKETNYTHKTCVVSICQGKVAGH